VVGTVRSITFSHHSQEFFFSDDLPWMSLGPVQVLNAQLPTRGIPRLSRSRARPLLALWVQGSRGTASERITTVSLDSIRSQLFFNGTGLSVSSGRPSGHTVWTQSQAHGDNLTGRRAGGITKHLWGGYERAFKPRDGWEGPAGRGYCCQPDSGKPTVRDERGAYGNVSYGGTRNPLHKPTVCPPFDPCCIT
jgi:hypothetical protein